MTTRRRVLAVVAGLVLLALLPVPVQADLFGRDDATTGDTEIPGAAGPSGESPETSGADQGDTEIVPAYTAEELAEALPLSWHGTFAWDEGVAFYVEMDIVKLTVRPDGDVAFNAESRWYPDLLEARMSGRIDPATLAVRIWEIAADEGAEDFESDGSYTGVFAADLWDLRARWETTGTGESGDLVLITTAEPNGP